MVEGSKCMIVPTPVCVCVCVCVCVKADHALSNMLRATL